jgi:protein-tyrosine sulfotransferase
VKAKIIYLRERFSYSQLIRRIKKQKNSSKNNPFFIISAGRSGSTLLRKHLQFNPSVNVPPESEDYIMVLSKIIIQNEKSIAAKLIGEYLNSREWLKFWMIDKEEFIEKIKIKIIKGDSICEIIDLLYETHRDKFKPNAILLGDKTPLLNNYLDLIAYLYSDSKVIYLIRDGRAVINSYIKTREYSLEKAVLRWKTSVKIYTKFKNKFGDRIYLVKYEDYISNPELELSKICTFLNIEYTSKMLSNEIINLGDSHLSHHQNIQKPIDISTVYKWKTELNKSQIVCINKSIKRELMAFNYIL